MPLQIVMIIRLVIGLIALQFTQFAYADDYADAASELEYSNRVVVRLTPEQQSAMQKYFEDIMGMVKLKEEWKDGLPKVILFKVIEKDSQGQGEELAFVDPADRRFVFWNAEFFVESKFVDVDRYIMAHELGHFTDGNKDQRTNRASEYETDASAIAKRVFRMGERDDAGNPQAGIAHIDTLIEFLSSIQGYRESYINSKTLVAGMKVLYAQERSRRAFPEAPTSREFLNDLRAAVLQAMPPSRSHRSSGVKMESGTMMTIDVAIDRIQNNWIEALKRLDSRREREAMTDRLRKEFTLTLNEFEKEIYKTRKKSRRLAKLFEQFATLPPQFFSPWQAPGAPPPSSWEQFYKFKFIDFVESLGLVSPVHLREVQIADSFVTRARTILLLLNRDTVVTGTSRLMRYLNENPNSIELENSPLLVFALRVLEGSAAKELNEYSLFRSSPTFARFRRLYSGKLQRLAADPGVARAILNTLERDFDDNLNLTLLKLCHDFDIEQLFPGLRDRLLAQLDIRKYVALRFALGAGSVDPRPYVSDLLQRRQYPEFIFTITHVHETERTQEDSKFPVFALWTQFLQDASSELRQRPYSPGFGEATQKIMPFRGALPKPDVLLKMMSSRADIKHLSQLYTQRVLLNPMQFILAWHSDIPKMHPDNRDNQIRVLPILVDWTQVFEKLTANQLTQLLRDCPTFFVDKWQSIRWFQQAFVDRILQLIERQHSIDEQTFGLAVATLNRLSSASPSSQKLTQMLLQRLQQATGNSVVTAQRMLELLKQVRVTNFPNTDEFITTYADAVAQSYGVEFKRVPMDQLDSELDIIQTKFDPQIAARIYARLAEKYQATWNLKARFSVNLNRRASDVATVVDDFHMWNEVFRKLPDKHAVQLIEFLRGRAGLPPQLQFELRLRLALANVMVQEADVERYVLTRFSQLTPLYRAGVFEVILEGTSNLLNSRMYRRKIFLSLLRPLEDRQTRSVFLDLWEAGLQALPKSLRSLVLSVVLSESGAIGSPERALVTLLRHMGPLEQKFGQVLAFADLPEAYRAELRTLWDDVQRLSWWDAWELILVQKGDIRKAGYKLSRVLNSGSTEAYLEIENIQTGEKRVMSVFRDGVQQSILTGAQQLRSFVGHLAEKNPRRYGFLPLLVEDSIRTVSYELNSEHKRRMTALMGAAYQNAGRRLGYSIETDGKINGGAIRFTTLPYKRMDLPDGKVVYTQQLADGVPLRELIETDPKLYRSISQQLLKLESEVLKDSSAPVDKDRMPGQYIVSRTEPRVVYILDQGQALPLDREVHDVFVEFTRRGFAGDTDWMLSTIKQLTGVLKLPEALAKSQVASVDVGIRALTFLSVISSEFLGLPNGDRRKERFFQLVHGVRAQLRLLQWDQSEGLAELGWKVKEEVIASMTNSQKVGAVANRARTGTLDVWQRIKDFMTIPTFRMERSYKRQERRPTPLQCQSLSLTP